MSIIELKPMSRIILFALTLSILGVSCSQKNGITGTFTGLTNDTLWIRVSVLNDKYQFERERTDTVVVKDGKFFYNPQTNNLTELFIQPLGNIDRMPGGIISYGPGATMTLLYFPSDHIRLDAINEDEVVAFRAKGNRYNEQLSTLNANTQDAYKQRNDALKVVGDRSFEGDKTVYRERLREAVQIMNNNELNFICENPDDPFSAYLVASWNTRNFKDKILQYTDSLGAAARNSEFGKILRKNIENIYAYEITAEENKKKESAKKEMIGKTAPEFTLKGINGNDFSLTSLRGKYVVLDFWGSWCGWCLAAFVDIKKYHTAHPNEFEIVGIAFKDKPEKWRKSVEKYTLPWVNVFDDDDFHEKYYVTYAPTYVLLNKEGIIVDFPQGHHEVIKQLNELREKGLL